jgi:hypothetical protein
VTVAGSRKARSETAALRRMGPSLCGQKTGIRPFKPNPRQQSGI